MRTERRQHTRLSLSVQVDVTSDSNFFIGRTRDLSMGGLFIETPVPLPIGSAVSVLLVLKGIHHALDGEVTWALDGDDGSTVGVGVRFKYLTSRVRNAILAFMKDRAPLEFEMFEPEPESDAAPAARPAPDADHVAEPAPIAERVVAAGPPASRPAVVRPPRPAAKPPPLPV